MDGGNTMAGSRKALAILLVIIITVSSLFAGTNIYRDLLLSQDYGDRTTYVIGHRSPDSDTVTSAIAYAYLLRELGIDAEPAVSGKLNNETATALSFLMIEPPQIVDNADNGQFILVDHSSYSQAIKGMDEARILGIVDHHGIGDVSTGDIVNVRFAPAGATVSIIYMMYMECGLPIPGPISRAMLVGLLSDTKNMTKGVTQVDRNAYSYLVSRAQIKDVDALYSMMERASTSYGNMSIREIFYSDCKEYEIEGKRFAIAEASAYGEEAVRKMTDSLYSFMEENYQSLGLDMLFAKVSNKNSSGDENMMYMASYGEGAAELLEEALGHYDGEKYFIFREGLSRKRSVVPAITDVLKKRK